MSNDHVKRMQDEHKELDTKLKALNAFIFGNPVFKTLDEVEQADMIQQAGFMKAYLATLDGRIWRAT